MIDYQYVSVLIEPFVLVRVQLERFSRKDMRVE